MLCANCRYPVPDSFHDFEKVCTCKTKEEWIQYYKKNKWMLTIDGERYDFTEREE